MALTITITDPKLIRLIEKKAEETGVTTSEAAERVLDARLSDESRENAAADRTRELNRGDRATRVAELVARMQARFTDEDRAFDHDSWLYDENGLPH